MVMVNRNARDNNAAANHMTMMMYGCFDVVSFHFLFFVRVAFVPSEPRKSSQKTKTNPPPSPSHQSTQSIAIVGQRIHIQFKLNIPTVSSATAMNFMRNFFSHELQFIPFGRSAAPSPSHIRCAHLHRISINMCLKCHFASNK